MIPVSVKVLYHPRISMGRAEEIARAHGAGGAIVYCMDCIHERRRSVSVCWCDRYSAERSFASPRECEGFDEYPPF